MDSMEVNCTPSLSAGGVWSVGGIAISSRSPSSFSAQVPGQAAQFAPLEVAHRRSSELTRFARTLFRPGERVRAAKPIAYNIIHHNDILERNNVILKASDVPEKRLDTDGGAYTKEEFFAYHGGSGEWKKAKVATEVPLIPAGTHGRIEEVGRETITVQFDRTGGPAPTNGIDVANGIYDHPVSLLMADARKIEILTHQRGGAAELEPNDAASELSRALASDATSEVSELGWDAPCRYDSLEAIRLTDANPFSPVAVAPMSLGTRDVASQPQGREGIVIPQKHDSASDWQVGRVLDLELDLDNLSPLSESADVSMAVSPREPVPFPLASPVVGSTALTAEQCTSPRNSDISSPGDPIVLSRAGVALWRAACDWYGVDKAASMDSTIIASPTAPAAERSTSPHNSGAGSPGEIVVISRAGGGAPDLEPGPATLAFSPTTTTMVGRCASLSPCGSEATVRQVSVSFSEFTVAIPDAPGQAASERPMSDGADHRPVRQLQATPRPQGPFQGPFQLKGRRWDLPTRDPPMPHTSLDVEPTHPTHQGDDTSTRDESDEPGSQRRLGPIAERHPTTARASHDQQQDATHHDSLRNAPVEFQPTPRREFQPRPPPRRVTTPEQTRGRTQQTDSAKRHKARMLGVRNVVDV